MIHEGDCLDILPTLDAESIDAVVTDPPYGIGFMGKEWDGFSPSALRLATANHLPIDHKKQTGRAASMRFGDWCEAWSRECLRVAKPGAYLLAFGGTRTVHRMTCAIEDAGWIIRDTLVWAYASGFPKGRANLKPAWEPIVMARKPGPLRPLAIDACRIPAPDADLDAVHRQADPSTFQGRGGNVQPMYSPAGRWPANVILTDPIFDGDWDGVVGGGESHDQTATYVNDSVPSWFGTREGQKAGTTVGYGDSGTYSRFFLVPKAARSDREPVLGGLEEREAMIPGTGTQKECGLCGERWVALNGLPKCQHGREHIVYVAQANRKRANVHPTVKPTELMRHLVRLVTPQGGTVLDPFLGSGTTALAAEMEGFAWVGIEREAEYVAIAEARLNGTQRGMAL